MRKLPLNNTSYQYLETAFREWLDILGYAMKVVYNLPNFIREFLHYLEQRKILHLSSLTSQHIIEYHRYLSSRRNDRKGGALSSRYINAHLFALDKFFEFLHHKGVQNLPHLHLKRLEIDTLKREILTVSEIKELHTIAKEQQYSTEKQEALNYQDVVLLSVYYACGLRRTEGISLCLEDINLDTQILHVKKGKGGKQRLIPFNKAVKECFTHWIYEYRMLLVKEKTEPRLFINRYGKPITAGTLNERLQKLIDKSTSLTLKEKHITLHSLRHSIATHLLAGGMDIQKVQQFLGHSSLDTTEIYTHLAEEMNNK